MDSAYKRVSNSKLDGFFYESQGRSLNQYASRRWLETPDTHTTPL